MKSKITYLKKLELFKELDNSKEGQFFAVADQKAKNHLPQWVQFSPHVLWLKSPEEEKNLETYSKGVEFFLKQGIKKDSHIYAFGGGATTDLAGFVAATLLEGIKWSVVPTTLFGMVEGSIGGKVGINTASGKNLLGLSHVPESVYICGDFLNTLSEKDILSGKGELLKYGFLSKEINSLILNKSPLEEIAFACAKFKNYVIGHKHHDESGKLSLELGNNLARVFQDVLKIPQGYALAMSLKYLFKIMQLEESLYQWNMMVKALSMPVEKLEVGFFSNFDFQAFMNVLDLYSPKNSESLVPVVLAKNIASQYVEEIFYKDLKGKLQSDDEFRRLA